MASFIVFAMKINGAQILFVPFFHPLIARDITDI
jgi:hypothetical protein